MRDMDMDMDMILDLQMMGIDAISEIKEQMIRNRTDKIDSILKNMKQDES